MRLRRTSIRPRCGPAASAPRSHSDASGAILVGYAGPWALEYRGSESFFWLMAGALVVTCLSLATVRRHVPAAIGESLIR